MQLRMQAPPQAGKPPRSPTTPLIPTTSIFQIPEIATIILTFLHNSSSYVSFTSTCSALRRLQSHVTWASLLFFKHGPRNVLGQCETYEDRIYESLGERVRVQDTVVRLVRLGADVEVVLWRVNPHSHLWFVGTRAMEIRAQMGGLRGSHSCESLGRRKISEQVKNDEDTEGATLMAESKEGETSVEGVCRKAGTSRTGSETTSKEGGNHNPRRVHTTTTTDGGPAFGLNSYPLLWASEKGFSSVIQVLLTETQMDVHIGNDCAFRCAAHMGHYEVVRLLVDAGADIHAQDDEALRAAAEKGFVEITRLLIERGANVGAKEQAALRWAARNGYDEVVRLLLAAGADANAQDALSLRWAAFNGHAVVTKLLLEASANASVLDNWPLILAVQYGHLEIVRLLLQFGADPGARKGMTYKIAGENGHKEVMRILEAAVAASKPAVNEGGGAAEREMKQEGEGDASDV
ncbi:hypothetical protein HK102_002363 [Quaeritorhiza haematococci]|nr:hypothetical protein HK102_002363 [Quaeritorhiza haematococci]